MNIEELLTANRTLLDEKKDVGSVYEVVDSVVIQPVSIGNNVRIVNSIIGPYVSIASDAHIENSIISNSVIGVRAHISKVNLQSSIIGDDATLMGKHNLLNIGDSSSIEF